MRTVFPLIVGAALGLVSLSCQRSTTTAPVVPDVTGVSEAQLHQHVKSEIANYREGEPLGDFLTRLHIQDAPFDRLYTNQPGHESRVYHLGKFFLRLDIERRDGKLYTGYFAPGLRVDGLTREQRLQKFNESLADYLRQKQERLESTRQTEVTPVPMTLVGTRDFPVGEIKVRIPWYRLDADYNATSTAEFWKSVEAPAGTKTTYVGHYGEVRWCKWLDDQSHEMMRAKGLLFIVPEEYRVAPGPGTVRVRWWLYEEQTSNDAMAFRDGRYYVFCLDRQPVQQWINLAEEPSCDMDSELPHAIAIIEIHPTFDFGPRPSSPALYLTHDSLLAYREERYSNLSSSYELEYAVTRTEGDRFECQTPQGHRAARPEVIQKLLYALNTCTWQPQKRPHRFEEPAVARTLIAYLDDQGERKTALIEYDGGGWHLQYPEKKYYSTLFPYLLYEVENDVVTACSQNSRDKVPDKERGL